MFYTIFNRQRRRVEKELQEKSSETHQRKPSMSFRPEECLIHSEDSEMVIKLKVKINSCRFFPHV